MAKSFIYPSASIPIAVIEGGAFVEATGAFGTGATPANESRLTDQSTGSAVGDFEQDSGVDDEGIRIDLSGSSLNNDTIALYFSTTETDDMVLTVDGVADNTSPDQTINIIADHAANVWTVQSFTADQGRYWFLRRDTGTISGLMEMILGNKYDFVFERDLNNTIGEAHGVDVVTSYGGVEYANKRHNSKTVWAWTWTNISSAMKTSLETMRDIVGVDKKFLFYDETSYHYVRMSADSLQFTETAHLRYSTSIRLTQQLQ